jgi:hypothetical protein
MLIGPDGLSEVERLDANGQARRAGRKRKYGGIRRIAKSIGGNIRAQSDNRLTRAAGESGEGI